MFTLAFLFLLLTRESFAFCPVEGGRIAGRPPQSAVTQRSFGFYAESVSASPYGSTSTKDDSRFLLLGTYHLKSDVLVPFEVRTATHKDIPDLIAWFNDPSSKLKSYTKSELASYITKSELYIATCSSKTDAKDEQLLGSAIVQCLTGAERENLLHKIGCLPESVVAGLFPDATAHVHISGLKIKPEFAGSRGQLDGKTTLNIGAMFVVSLAHHQFEQETCSAPRFSVSGGTSLASLTTLNMAPLLQKQILRGCKYLLHSNTIVQEHTIPGTEEDKAILTVTVVERRREGEILAGATRDITAFNTKIFPRLKLRAMVATGGVSQQDSGSPTQVAENEKEEQKEELVRQLQDSGISVKYLEPTTLVHGRMRRGIFDIMPRSSQQVQDIVRAAGVQHEDDFIGVISRGKRWGAANSGSVPALRLNLSELQGIPLVDLANGIIVVEPGVSQGRVSDLLRGSGWYLPVTGSCRHSSLVGNAVDGGITSAGLRIDQVLGVEAVDTSNNAVSTTGAPPKIIRTGVLASSSGLAHGYALQGGTSATSFLFQNDKIVTKMAFGLKRLPKYIGAAIVVGTDKALIAAHKVRHKAAWWQLRVEPTAGSVVVVAYHGDSVDEIQLALRKFQNELGQQGQIVYGSTDVDAPEPIVQGQGPFPEFFLKSGFGYFQGIPSCDHHHHVLATASCSEAPVDGQGFRLCAFAVPMNPTVIALLRDEILQAAALNQEHVKVTITVTPMSSHSMYFLVWANFDRDMAGVEESFFRTTEHIMAAAKCPSCRYSHKK